MFNHKKSLEVAEKIASSTNIIGRGTTIQGDIESEGSFRIEGRLLGNISTQSKLILASGAYLKGNILAKEVEIGGNMEGKIEALEILTLRAKANIKGTLHTRRLIVEVGAQFNGQCRMHDLKSSASAPQLQKEATSAPQLQREATSAPKLQREAKPTKTETADVALKSTG